MKIIEKTGLLVSLIAINQVLVITPTIGFIYYVLIGVALLIGLSHSLNGSLNPLLIWIIFASILSIVFNEIPAFFNAPLRLITFIIVVSLVGPLIITKGLMTLRNNLFKSLNKLIFIFSVASFLLYLFGISLGANTGGFSGFFNHSMMMGPIASIALIITLYKYYSTKNTALRVRTKSQKWFLIIAMFILFFIILLASSRAALLGAVAGVLFFIYKVFQNRISGFLTVLIFLTMLLIATFPLWSDYTVGIANKQRAIEDSGDLLTARRDHWEARLNEFKSKPIFGIGFASVSIQNNRSDYNIETGGIEPGTSWLAILSMVGVFGFIPLLILFGRSLTFLLNSKKQTLNCAVLGALLMFFITHMFAEGYIFSSGSFLFFYLWLILGVVENLRRTGKVLIV